MPETRHAMSSPLQNGLLFNSLSLSEPGVDVIQVICQLPEGIKPAPFLQSWQIISARYEVLRTAFHWEETARPRQEMYAEISVPFRVEDWSGSPAGECEARLECFLREDRQQAFAVWTPPLWRVALFLLSAEASRCVFTFHHAILDGRSLPTVLGDVFACYRALLDGTPEAPERPPAPSVQAEAAPWWQPGNQEADELFWRQTLAGFDTPLTLPEEERNIVEANPLSAGASHSEEDLALSSELSQALRAFATEHDLTLNAM
ncbi:MAG TPA: condensation domain-containing protein, partial [Ktedonobacteraceae bacterium]|nr:condensation domain-containing protein [Ktedonobacteraceae bacterium]